MYMPLQVRKPSGVALRKGLLFLLYQLLVLGKLLFWASTVLHVHTPPPHCNSYALVQATVGRVILAD